MPKRKAALLAAIGLFVVFLTLTLLHWHLLKPPRPISCACASEECDFTVGVHEEPLRILIVTTWRSGSTFMGDLFTSIPTAFYHYEPYLHEGIRRMRRNEDLRHLRSLFQCDYRGVEESYFSYGLAHPELFSHNRRLWRRCTRRRRSSTNVCMRRNVLAQICLQSPIQVAKTVRLPLRLAASLMEEPAFADMRVILLVRDPRASMESRRHRTWCRANASTDNADCSNPARLCADMLDDYHQARGLAAGANFAAVRYEDFVRRPDLALEAAGLVPTERTRKFLAAHTRTDVGGVSSTRRNSVDAPYKWATRADYGRVLAVEKVCAEAMAKWRYRPFDDEGAMRGAREKWPLWDFRWV